MRKGRLLHLILAGFTVIVALMSCGLADLSTQSTVYANGLASARARLAPPPPKGPDLGRFKPIVNVPKGSPAIWKPSHSVSHAPKAPTISRPAAAPARTPGEQQDMRTATSSTYLNKDGSWTVKSTTVPIHYQDAQGHWQNIDTSIIADTSDAGYALGNKANSWHVHFAQQSGGSKLVHADLNSVQYFEAISNTAAVNAVTNGSQVIYPSIFPNVDAVYTMLHTSMEETFLLHSANVPSTITLTYHVPGATAQQDPQGNIVFTDNKGVVVLVVSAPVMFEADAHGQMTPTGAASNQVSMALSGQGPDYTVTLTPDMQWLADPSRKFPVAIDPTYWGGDGHSASSSYGDTYVSSYHPTWNFDTVNAERVGNCSALPSGALGYGTGVNRSYLKFPAGTPPSPASATHVTSATLTLWQTSAYAGSTQINVGEVKSSWDETTIDWNNQPGGGWLKGSANTNTGYNMNLNITVTDLLYDWWEDNQPNYGLILGFQNESVPCDFFASDDYGSHLPTLTVNYAQDGQWPSASLSINAQNGYKDPSGNLFTNNPNVSLSPTVSDPDTNAWSSNWTTVNGVTGDTYGHPMPHFTPSDGGSEVIADTSSCGGTQCPAGTAFSYTPDVNKMPTFTAMFKWDGLGGFNFGVSSSSNSSDRWDLYAPAGGNAFTTIEYSLSSNPSTFNSGGVSIPFAANTWYYGQVAFPYADAGEIRLWPVGGQRPDVPTVSWTGLSVVNPRLTFWEMGDNGANLHSYSISNVTISQGTATNGDGFGVWGIGYSNDNTNWSCPSPASGTWCVGTGLIGGATGLTPGWTLPGGDGQKNVYIRAQDNADHVSGGVSATVNLDQTPPTSSITSPIAGREVRGAVTVLTQASDPTVNGVSSGMAQLNLDVDGQPAIGSPLSGSTPGFIWDTTDVAPGPHMLSLVATDNLGNTSTSAGVLVDVANTGQASYDTYALRDLPDDYAAGANVANGDALIMHQDLDIPGRGPQLSVTRTYNGLAQINNLFGWGWTSELDEGLIANSDGSVTCRDPEGGLHVFLPNGSGGYLASPGLYLTLTKNSDGTFTLIDRNQLKTNFTSAGYIASVVDRNGNTLTVSYSGTTPTTVTDASGRTLAITVSGGHVTKITDPGSRVYQYAYDGSNNLISYTDPAGTVTQYTYDGSHHLTKIIAGYVSGAATDADTVTNVMSTLTYDTEGRLAQVLDPLGFDANFNYGAFGSMQTQVQQLQTAPTNTTPSSSQSEYELTTYALEGDGSGVVATITDPFGGKTQNQYDSNDNITQATDPDGHVTTYTFDANGNELKQVVDPGGLNLTTTWAYDSSNNLVTQTDPKGIVTQYTYDTAAQGDLTSVVKHYVANQPATSDQNVTTTYLYDGFGEVETETAPPDANAYSAVTQYTYDSAGDVTQTVKNYDPNKPADSATNVTSTATYNALGERLTSTDALNHVTQYTYDALGDVTKSIQNYVAGGANDSETNVTTMAGFDAFGRKTTDVNARGFTTLTLYDEDGRVIKTVQNSVTGAQPTSDVNVTTTTAYDAAGNATLTTDPQGTTTTTTYDADNRVREVQVTNSVGATISDKKTNYDLAGLVAQTQVVDGASNPVTTYQYDNAGRQDKEIDPPTATGKASNEVITSYDGDGNITEQQVTNTDVTGDVSDTTMQYDNLGRTTLKTEDANTSSPQATVYSYAANGLQTSVSAPAGSGTTLTQNVYDALGHLLSQTQQAGTSNAQTTSYTYDVLGETLTTSNSAGTTSLMYDALGRILNQTQDTSAGVTQTSVANTYDNNGNLLTSAASYGSGSGGSVVMNFSYDPLDREISLTDGNRSYTYDANGNLTGMTVKDPNTGASITSMSAMYDGGNRLTNQTDTFGPSTAPTAPSQTYGYSYSGAGDRVTATMGSNGTTTSTTTYTYDNAHQLTGETTGASVISYVYDTYNNRSTMTTSAGVTSYAYDPTTHTELTSKTDPNGKITSYTYDGSGNLTSAVYDASGVNQTTGYTYTGNQLTKVTMPTGTTIAFGYDANNQRSSTTVTPAGGGSASVVNDFYQFGRLAYQTNGAGALLATYTYDERGAPVSVQVGSSSTSPRYYYVYDARGDVVNLTDASGAVVATYAYDAWGNLTTSSENIPNANGWVNPFRFDGRDGVRYDGSDGLYWMSVRAYDPTIGRFLSRDPLGRAPLFFADNPYVYAGNNPLSNVDPSGQYRAAGHGAQTQVESWTQTKRHVARIVQQSGCNAACQAQIHAEWVRYHVGLAKGADDAAMAYFKGAMTSGPSLGIATLSIFLAATKGAPVVTGILNWIDTWILHASLSKLLWDVVNVSVLTYDLVAAFAYGSFWLQSQQDDGYWLDADNLHSDWSSFGFALSLIGTLLIGLVVPLLVLAVPGLSAFWIGLGIGVLAAIIRVLPKFKYFVDQEEQAMGYTLS